MSGARRLYFLRHGLADRSAYTGTDDRLRPLTPDGIARMEAEGRAMSRLDLSCERILTSPLTRCLQTAEIAADALGLTGSLRVEPSLACGFGPDDLPPLLETHADCRALMLVGHEPDFSWAVSSLTGGSDLVFKKGSLARVDLHPGEGLSGSLVWLLPPKILALD